MSSTGHSPRNVLVTGGAGFIGANFVEHLLETDSTANVVTLDSLTYAGSLENLARVMSSPRHQFVKGDITEVEVDAVGPSVRADQADRAAVHPGSVISEAVRAAVRTGHVSTGAARSCPR